MEDGRVGIDNNPVEHAMRPTAVGQKNWLSIGEAEARERAAILRALTESCRSHGLDPFAWLRGVLTPAACAKAAGTAKRQAARSVILIQLKDNGALRTACAALASPGDVAPAQGPLAALRAAPAWGFFQLGAGE